MPHHRTVGTPDRLAAVAQNHCWGGGRESAGTPNTDHCPNIPTLQPFATTALESPQHTCRCVQISHTRQRRQAEVSGRDALSQASASVNIEKVLGACAPVNMAPPSDTTAYFSPAPSRQLLTARSPAPLQLAEAAGGGHLDYQEVPCAVEDVHDGGIRAGKLHPCPGRHTHPPAATLGTAADTVTAGWLS